MSPLPIVHRLFPSDPSPPLVLVGKFTLFPPWFSLISRVPSIMAHPALILVSTVILVGESVEGDACTSSGAEREAGGDD